LIIPEFSGLRRFRKSEFGLALITLCSAVLVNGHPL